MQREGHLDMLTGNDRLWYDYLAIRSRESELHLLFGRRILSQARDRIPFECVSENTMRHRDFWSIEDVILITGP